MAKSKSAKKTATKKTKTGLYPYTLQPIAVNMSEDEFHQAQLALFNKSSQAFGLSNIKTTEWIVMAVAVVLAIAGLVYVSGYSTILFWLMLVGVVVYLLIRTIGMKWYMKREFEKQMAEAEFPEEMSELKLGVQKNGLIMSMPNPNAPQPNSKAMRGMQMRMSPVQQAVIPWSAVTSWDETDDYVFIMFEAQGQRGSQIIPKRMQANKFPIDSVRKHLQEVKAKGLQSDSIDD